MKREDITALLVGLGLVSHIAGYFFWPLVKAINLYYVSIYFMMINIGIAFMLVFNGGLMRWVNVGLFSFGGGFLYIEFAGNPQDWTGINLATFTFICTNSFLVSHHIDKYKHKHKNKNDG